MDDDVGAERQWPQEQRRREGGIDGERRAARVCEFCQCGNVDDPEQRVGDRLDVEQRGRGLLERALDFRVIGRVDEVDLRAALADPALEQRAGLSVRVLLRDDAAAAGEGAGIDERGDRGHAAREAHRGLGAIQLRERVLERGSRGRAVAAVDVSGLVAAKDTVLIGGGAIVERDALDERRDEGRPCAGRQDAGRSHDPRPDALRRLTHEG